MPAACARQPAPVAAIAAHYPAAAQEEKRRDEERKEEERQEKYKLALQREEARKLVGRRSPGHTLSAGRPWAECCLLLPRPFSS
jgi:hypothetical protein